MTVVPPSLAHVEADSYRRRMSSGRTSPLVLGCSAPDGSTVECVVKPLPNVNMPPVGYAFEWIGSALACGLGIPTPQPFAVKVSHDLAAVAPPGAVRTDLTATTGLAFGSGLIISQNTPWVRGTPLSPVAQTHAALVIGLDAYIHNPDRREDNPNLFAGSHGLVVFDHEMAFSFLFALGGDPVTSAVEDILERHVIARAYRGQGLSFGEFRNRLSQLDNTFLARVQSEIPTEWTVGDAGAKIATVMSTLRDRRDAIDRWLPKVEQWVAR